MAYTNKVTWETLRTIDTATMSSATTYYAIGTALAHPSYKLRLVNASNVLVTISIDGVNNVDVLPAGSAVLYDESQAQFPNAFLPSVPQGTQFFAKSATAGTGLVYLVNQYLVVS